MVGKSRPPPRQAAAAGATSNARGASAQPLLDLGLLREMSAPRANGIRAADNSMGRRSIQRPTTAVRSLHYMRPQGSGVAASGMGGHAHRLSAIPRFGRVLITALSFRPQRSALVLHFDPFDQGRIIGGRSGAIDAPRHRPALQHVVCRGA
jgi:hypothetical protein